MEKKRIYRLSFHEALMLPFFQKIYHLGNDGGNSPLCLDQQKNKSMLGPSEATPLG